MIRRVYEVDPLVCPRCQGVMRVVAFITEPRVIRTILAHLARRLTEDRTLPPLSTSSPSSPDRQGRSQRSEPFLTAGPRTVPAIARSAHGCLTKSECRPDALPRSPRTVAGPLP